MEKVRTRFAPSPTGYMHIGNLRSAIFEYILAKKYNGDFILRIEDTDQTRKVDGATEYIYDVLKTCNMIIDEGPSNPGEYGPYIQSERLNLYRQYANKLLESGDAYVCFCNEQRLNTLREKAENEKRAFQYDGYCKNISKDEVEKRINNGEKYVIRQNMPSSGYVIYEDIVYGTLKFENNLLEDQILIKSDGFPTYNFANVVDDILMNITHVARGCEYLSSTPKYSNLYKAFGKKEPVYVHLPHVIKEDGKKLSKRDGDASFGDLLKQGYLPSAIVNYLCLLGFSPKDNIEIFDLDHICITFDESKISKSPAVYDIKKLNWVNAHYIKKLSDEDLYNLCIYHLENAYDLSDKKVDWISHLIRLYKEHISYGEQIIKETKLFFNDQIHLDNEASEFLKSDDNINNTLKIFKEEIKSIEDWSIENIKNAINSTKEKSGVKGKMLFMPIRIACSGLMHGPELTDTLYLIGKNKLLKRL
ncbi:MAG: glutamate--tRNA ligase [Bacilli bacterium]